MITYKVLLDSTNINCKPNSILSSKIHNYLKNNAHIIVNNLSQADYIVLNTCGFNETFENISMELFKKYGVEKKCNAKIITIGCLNKINESLRDKFSDIIFLPELEDLDSIFFNILKYKDNKEAYLKQEIISDLSVNNKRGFAVSDKITLMLVETITILCKKLRINNPKLLLALEEVKNENKFYVEIGRGCGFACNYCVIKKARGEMHSRRITQILSDIDTVFEPNKKLCLIADDCGSYGIDINENIFSLLYAINKKHPTLYIDLCYVNPLWIQKYEKEFLELFKNVKINSINIPMQSGSDKIIQLMNRDYSVEKVLGAIENFRQISPDTLIWSHIIIGFPGESRADFRRSMSMSTIFDFSYKFIYTEKKGTASAFLPNKVPEIIKKYRLFRFRVKGVQIFIKCICRSIFTNHQEK